MRAIGNSRVRVTLDERWPRVMRFENVRSGTRLWGDKLAAPPRLAIYRLSAHEWITSDHEEVEVAYTLSGTSEQAAYRARVSFAGRLWNLMPCSGSTTTTLS